MSDTGSEKTDFGAMLDQHLARAKTTFKIGDKVSGRITHIDGRTVYVDINGMGDAMMDRIDVLDDGGNLTVKVGETLEGRVVSEEDGEIRLSRKLNSAALADASLWDAYQARVPVEGRVAGECKGGFEVMVGNLKGFCPYSQIDLWKQDAAAYIGQKLLFLVREYTEDGRRLVLNRRSLLEAEQKQQRQELQERLKVGDILTGRVRKIQPFGAFVCLGAVDGLIPVSELSWKRGVKPEDIVQEGQDVTVMVRDLDWEKNRISLSLKQTQGDPWSLVETKYLTGTEHMGTVTQLMPFGAFVELEPGIEGLIHISKLGGGRRIRSAEEVVKIGDQVEVTIDNIDRERHRISLVLNVKAVEAEEPPAPAAVTDAPPADGAAAETVAVGAEVTGTIESIKDFGVFIRLPNGKAGLLHISQMDLPDSPARLRSMYNQFPAGKAIKVIVKAIEGDRVSLTLRSMLEKDSEQVHFEEFRKTNPQASTSAMGSLGALVDFSKLNLSE